MLESSTEMANRNSTATAWISNIKFSLGLPLYYEWGLQGQLTPRERLKGIMEMSFLMESYDEREVNRKRSSVRNNHQFEIETTKSFGHLIL